MLTAAERRRIRRAQQFSFSDDSSDDDDNIRVRRPCVKKKSPVSNRHANSNCSSSDDDFISQEKKLALKKNSSSKQIVHRETISKEDNPRRKASLPKTIPVPTTKEGGVRRKYDSSDDEDLDTKMNKESPLHDAVAKDRQSHDDDEDGNENDHRTSENRRCEESGEGKNSNLQSLQKAKGKSVSWHKSDSSSSSYENSARGKTSKPQQHMDGAGSDSDDEAPRGKGRRGVSCLDDSDSDVSTREHESCHKSNNKDNNKHNVAHNPLARAKFCDTPPRLKAKELRVRQRRESDSLISNTSDASNDGKKLSDEKLAHTSLRPAMELDSLPNRLHPLASSGTDFGGVARNPLTRSRVGTTTPPSVVAALPDPSMELLWDDSSSSGCRSVEEKSNARKKKKDRKKTESPGAKKKKTTVQDYDLDEDETRMKPDFSEPLFGPWDLEPLRLMVPEIEPDGLEEETERINRQEILQRRVHLEPIRELCKSKKLQVPASIARYLGKYQQQGVQFMFRTIFQNGGGILGDGQ